MALSRQLFLLLFLLFSYSYNTCASLAQFLTTVIHDLLWSCIYGNCSFWFSIFRSIIILTTGMPILLTRLSSGFAGLAAQPTYRLDLEIWHYKMPTVVVHEEWTQIAILSTDPCRPSVIRFSKPHSAYTDVGVRFRVMYTQYFTNQLSSQQLRVHRRRRF